MLLGDFFSILSTENVDPQGYRFTLRLNPHHAIYQGHFPGNPVVPGVCQIGIIREATESLLGLKLMVSRADQVKFLQMINPEVTSELVLDLVRKSSESSGFEISATLRNDTTVFMKFRGCLCTR